MKSMIAGWEIRLDRIMLLIRGANDVMVDSVISKNKLRLDSPRGL